MRKRSQKKTAVYESTHSYQSLPVAAPFSANPDVVRVVVEGERLTYGHLFNPAFATEISLIEPLPHQRIALIEKINDLLQQVSKELKFQ